MKTKFSEKNVYFDEKDNRRRRNKKSKNDEK